MTGSATPLPEAGTSPAESKTAAWNWILSPVKAGEKLVELAHMDSKKGDQALPEEHHLQKAEELSSILETLPVPVLIVHDSAARHITLNRAAECLLKISGDAGGLLTAPAEAGLRPFKVFKDGRELKNDELPILKAVRGLPVRDFEFSIVFDDGTTRHVLSQGTTLRDNEGRPCGAVIVMIDISVRKQAELAMRTSSVAALNLMEDALEARQAAERMSAKLRASNEDLARFNRAAVDRELRMIELKKQVNGLCARAGLPPAYALEFEATPESLAAES